MKCLPLLTSLLLTTILLAENPPNEEPNDPDFNNQIDTINHQPQEDQGTLVINSANFALKNDSFNLKRAQRLFNEALKYKLTDNQKQNVLLTLASLYEQTNQPGKTIITLQKYVESFPNGEITAEIYLKLGRLYRNMRANELAIKSFYKVFDLALTIDPKDLPTYKTLSLEAQLEITDTYFLMKQYDKVVKLFARLEQSSLPPKEAERLLFKTAYSYYNLKDHNSAISNFNTFLQNFPDSDYTPESYYTLINAYNDANKPQDAVTTMIQFLKQKPSGSPEIIGNWTYWKQKSSNQLANKFYEAGDFTSALKIYQVMATLSPSPSWQWPVIYQIGRCYEQLMMRDKAIESYSLIVKEDEWKDQKYDVSPSMKELQDTAKWRLDQIHWIDNQDARLDKVISPKLKKDS